MKLSFFSQEVSIDPNDHFCEGFKIFQLQHFEVYIAGMKVNMDDTNYFVSQQIQLDMCQNRIQEVPIRCSTSTVRFNFSVS